MEFPLSAAQKAAMQKSLQEAKRARRLPAHSRAAAERERRAIRDALAGVVGGPEADRLVELADNLPPEEPLPAPPDNAWTRAQQLMETREGRERLRTLQWEQI